MKKIGIIGAGVMGTDIAQAFAQADYEVSLVDQDASKFEVVKKKIKNNLRFQKLHTSLAVPLSYDQIIGKISFATTLACLKSLDMIIENVTEDWKIKRDLHIQLEEFSHENTLMAINTSAISITRIGSLKRFPQNVVGVHFMNPAYIMPTVEVIRGYHTSESTIERTQSMLVSIGKKSIVVKDSPGFITNRAMMIFVNEAAYCLSEGVASREDIDKLFKECFGHKMGPLQTADLIGVDTILKSLEVLYESFNDDKYRPCFLLKQMVDAGLLGVKNGRGFYEYDS